MSFLGYYLTEFEGDGETMDTSELPDQAIDLDICYGVVKKVDDSSITYKIQLFEFIGEEWVIADEDPSIPINEDSINPFLDPIGDRVLNIYESFGMGILPKVYARISASDLMGPRFLEEKMGNSSVNQEDLTVYNLYTNTLINNADIPKIGILPVYIQQSHTNSMIVGVGSAIFTNQWRVLWYKTTEVPYRDPIVVPNIEQIIHDKNITILGNTTDYICDITIYTFSNKEESNHVNVSGIFLSDAGYTIYHLNEYIVDNVSTIASIAIRNELDDIIYKARNDTDINRRKSIAGLEYLDRNISFEENDVNTVTQVFKTNTGESIEVPVPIASSENAGFIDRLDYIDFRQASDDVQQLLNSTGKWIGQNFSTYAELQSYPIPETVSENDYTLVEVDESNGEQTTKWICVKKTIGGVPTKVFEFYQTIAEDTVYQIATSNTSGLVKSSSGGGNIGVDPITGVMSLNGYNILMNKPDFVALGDDGPLKGLNLQQCIAYINDVFIGGHAVIIDHKIG